MHLLTAQNLAVFRGERLVLKGVAFALGSGGMLLLRGENGAGKSTLLRAIAGLTPLAAGALLWDNSPALADRAAHAARIAWLGHLDAVKPALTVAEHVPLAALKPVGLERFAALPARFLSAGQKRRLAIARVAASGRPLWLLDEPTTGLDAASVDRFAALCMAHRAAGGMIIASTHTPLDLPDMEVLAL
nr:heme ABC exporter ATP-binding protein CcmA [Acidocella sp. KAb 2-4]